MNDYKPIILINLCTKEGDEMFYLRRGYLEALNSVGAIPITLPLMADRSYAARVIEFADGILLPGSITDVDPKYYDSEISPYFGQKGPERDSSDFFLLEHAFLRKVPVFGICYGHQSLNVFCGGSLHQDIAHDVHSKIQHWQGEPYHEPAHPVKLEKDSIVHRLYGQDELQVNSVHHQGVKSLAGNLKPTAYSPDGVVEAYESKNGHFLMGIQWHPERMFQEYPVHLNPFREFVGAAREWHYKNT